MDGGLRLINLFTELKNLLDETLTDSLFHKRLLTDIVMEAFAFVALELSLFGLQHHAILFKW